MSLIVRPLREEDLAQARRILSLSFGTFIGLPVPERFAADQDFVRTRWAADPTAAFAAEEDGRLVGSSFATRWGSVGFFGPITVDVAHWNRGIAQRLLEPTMECFERWKTTLAGLYTFAHSPKHVDLYAKYGFWPRSLTAILTKPVGAAARATGAAGVETYSSSPSSPPFASSPATAGGAGERQAAILDAARRVAGTVYPGLDLEREIRAADEQQLGDTVLLRDPHGDLCGFAVCHVGRETEAGEDAAYVKFGIVAAGSGARKRFEGLLDLVERFAANRGALRVDAGMSMAREKAFRVMRGLGYRIAYQGVVMHRPNLPGYSKPNLFVIDDWR